MTGSPKKAATRPGLRSSSAVELRRIVPGDLCDIADQLAEPFLVDRDAGERCAVGVHPVVAETARDDHRALGLAHDRPVAASDLAGGIDGIGSARAEEDGRIIHRAHVGDALGQRDGRNVGVIAEAVIR